MQSSSYKSSPSPVFLATAQYIQTCEHDIDAARRALEVYSRVECSDVSPQEKLMQLVTHLKWLRWLQEDHEFWKDADAFISGLHELAETECLDWNEIVNQVTLRNDVFAAALDKLLDEPSVAGAFL